MVFKQEISAVAKSVIGSDQFAYKEGTNAQFKIILCTFKLAFRALCL